MAKKVQFIKDREEAAQIIFQQSLDRTPEERIRWLYRQIELMNSLNKSVTKPRAHVLRKIHE